MAGLFKTPAVSRNRFSGPNPPGPPASDKVLRAVVENLGCVDLTFERDDSIQLVLAELPLAFLMIVIGAFRLNRQRRCARIGHHVHADRLARSRVFIQQDSQLHIERPVVWSKDVFEVGRRPWSSENRNRGPGAVQPPDRIAVHTGRITNDFDSELRVWVLGRRPGQPYAE